MKNDGKSSRFEDFSKSQRTEASFTLIETIIALGLMVIIVLEVSVVLGRSIDYSSYQRKMTQATWIAKGILAQVEAKWRNFPLKDVRANFKKEKVPSELCPEDARFDCNFSYDLVIEEWKLPLIDIAGKSLGDPSIVDMVKNQLKKILGDEILKVAYATVEWGESGAREGGSVSIAYLMTAEYKLNEAISMMKPVGQKSDPSKTDPSKTDPSKTDPSKTDPSKVDPLNPGG